MRNLCLAHLRSPVNRLSRLSSPAAAPTPASPGIMTIVVWPFDTPDEATGQLGDTISSSLNPQTVTGLGDHAITSDGAEPGMGRLAFTKGSYFVDLTAKLPAGTDVLAALTPVAQAIFGRLP